MTFPELTIPDPGQIVEVRRRQFVVTDVRRSTLPPDPLGRDGAPQHVVALSSVEDDALGEELSVVWEIEPGARIHGERPQLPEPAGFDDPQRLDAFLNAIRWGAVTSADIGALQAPFRSGIEIEDYQLDPIVRALQMPRVNLLIADDVGLGKTIEAGLVVQELMLRHRVRSVLVVVPASLQIKWRDEMREKFGLEFRIVDAHTTRELRRHRGIHVNPWTHFPRLITSIDYLKRERPLQRFRETLPAPGQPIFPRKFDLLIVDEAHNVAPAGTGNYATDSDRTQATRMLAPHFEHRLFITGTPHNGYSESFAALLALLDEQRFAPSVPPDRKQLEAVMVRRLKAEITNWDGTPRFPVRSLEAIEVDWSEREREAHRKLQRYAELRQTSSGEESGRVATEFVLKLLKKRLFSSPAAFLATLETHEKTLRGIGTDDDETPVRRKPLAGILRRELDDLEAETDDDEELEIVADVGVDRATRLFDRLGEEERRLLRELKDWARQATAKPDAKAKTLLAWLEATLRPAGKWNDERVILFTEYRATQKWLQGLLAREGFAAGERLAVIYGGMDEEAREEIKAAFQADPQVSPVRILLATDAASEGIDLQNHCHRLVHYEIPWNPNRLEQRNGRIDRHGQKAPQVLVYHFVGSGWDARAEMTRRPGDLEGDLEFLMRAALKVENIRQDLGKVGPVIAEQVVEAMLGRRSRLDTRQAERDAEPVRRMLTFERALRDQIARLHEKLAESRRELHLSPESIQAVVEAGLELAGQPKLREAKVAGLWPDRSGARTHCPVFTLPALRGSWADCAEGLQHPHTKAVRPITFDHDLAAGRDDVVLVHLNHRLVQMCQRLLRAEVWSHGEHRHLHRVTARIVPHDVLDGPAVVAHARLLVLGGTDTRLHEEILTAGGWLREGRFARMNVGQVQAVLAAATDESAAPASCERFQRLWPKIAGALGEALNARMDDRLKGLRRLLAEREAKETNDLVAILDELARTIRAELEHDAPRQMELWSREERGQLERDRELLRRRLAEIPDEIAREKARIAARYAEPAPRLFPVAVTFLVPSGMR